MEGSDETNHRVFDIVGSIYIPTGKKISIPIQNGKQVIKFHESFEKLEILNKNIIFKRF
jgi:hypothetical protein